MRIAVAPEPQGVGPVADGDKDICLTLMDEDGDPFAQADLSYEDARRVIAALTQALRHDGHDPRICRECAEKYGVPYSGKLVEIPRATIRGYS